MNICNRNIIFMVVMKLAIISTYTEIKEKVNINVELDACCNDNNRRPKQQSHLEFEI